MSSLTDLLLRTTVDPDYQTKGSTLTFEEVDANFILICDVIKESILSIVPGGIDAYDGGTEYKSGNLVTYAGNLWEYVNPTPSTGNTPGPGSSYWTIQSSGVLAHSQNTDTHTTQNNFGVGDGTDTDKDLFARNGDTNTPRLRYKASTSKWQFSNDGITFLDLDQLSDATAALDKLGINHDNVDVAVSAGVLSLNMNSKRERSFYCDDVQSSNFKIEVTNDSVARLVNVTVLITGSVQIEFDTDVVMQEDDTRWNNTTKKITVAGGTGSPFELTLAKVGSIYLLKSTYKYFAS
jgi:hypothetical protein